MLFRDDREQRGSGHDRAPRQDVSPRPGAAGSQAAAQRRGRHGPPGRRAAASATRAAQRDRRGDRGPAATELRLPAVPDHQPDPYNDKLVPPFAGHVLVGGLVPVAGQTYNILQIAVRNGTAQTFDATSNFFVRYPGAPQAVPILTGTQQWKPGQEFVFYVLSHKYYPLPSEVHSGFEFSLQGARSIGIPGPSGIFLRVKYNPATFDQTLDHIVAYGPGAQGGRGIKFGLPDTAIYEFVSSQTRRIDFSGYF